MSVVAAIGGLEKQSSSNIGIGGEAFMGSFGKKGAGKGGKITKSKSKKKNKPRKSINGIKAQSQKVDDEEENPEGANENQLKPSNMLQMPNAENRSKSQMTKESSFMALDAPKKQP